MTRRRMLLWAVTAATACVLVVPAMCAFVWWVNFWAELVLGK